MDGYYPRGCIALRSPKRERFYLIVSRHQIWACRALVCAEQHPCHASKRSGGFIRGEPADFLCHRAMIYCEDYFWHGHGDDACADYVAMRHQHLRRTVRARTWKCRAPIWRVRVIRRSASFSGPVATARVRHSAQSAFSLSDKLTGRWHGTCEQVRPERRQHGALSLNNLNGSTRRCLTADTF